MTQFDCLVVCALIKGNGIVSRHLECLSEVRRVASAHQGANTAVLLAQWFQGGLTEISRDFRGREMLTASRRRTTLLLPPANHPRPRNGHAVMILEKLVSRTDSTDLHLIGVTTALPRSQDDLACIGLCFQRSFGSIILLSLYVTCCFVHDSGAISLTPCSSAFEAELRRKCGL